MTYTRTAVTIACSILFTLSASFALAHHGWSWYGNDPFQLTAEVVDKHFGNPHDQLTLKSEDGQEWNVLLSPPSRSRRAGLTEDKINVGDTVTVFGHRRSKGNNFEMKTERLQIRGQLYNLYPDRG